MFKIGDFSKMCGVPVSALRYYADLGLLEPAQIDPFTSYRYYSLEQLPRLNRILALKDLGLSLEEIGRLLNEAVSSDELRGMFRLQQAKIQQQVEEEQARLARVAARLKQIEQEGKMPSQEVVLKTINAQHVLSIREIIPVPSYVGKLMYECFGTLSQAGIQLAASPQAIFHDEEFKPTDLDVEAVFPVADSIPPVVELPNGRQIMVRDLPPIPVAACIVHVGEFDTITEAYNALGQWIDSSGYRIVGPPHEIYLSAPEGNNSPVTEIQWPVEKV